MRLGKVISCFAGLGCGELALKQCGIETKELYAYETDKYAEAINRYHNPDTKFLGDITQWKSHTELIGGDVDLIMGGSPCQDLSIAGKRAGLKGERSSLVYVFADMVKYYKPRYFFLENVASMKKEDRDIITELMGVEPIEVNAALVSAQQRKRLYWTNIPYTKPENKRVYVKDILLQQEGRHTVVYKSLDIYKPEMRICVDEPMRLGSINGKTSQSYRVYSIYGKSPTVNAKDTGSEAKFLLADLRVIRLNPIECERLQTLPDNYTAYSRDKDSNIYRVSNTSRCRTIGNTWTLEVIKHFFKNIKEA